MARADRFAQSIAPDAENREQDDFYPTPPQATISLLALEEFGPHIWEPACGDGAMSRAIEEAGHEVVSTDLVARGYGQSRIDFLMESRLLAPEIITNPPFKMAEAFVLHALALGARKVALLLRLAYLEGEGRKRRIFDQTPLARVHVSSRRINFLRGGVDGGNGGGSMIAFAWFVWEIDHVGDPALKFFDWKDYAPEFWKEKTTDVTVEEMPLFK